MFRQIGIGSRLLGVSWFAGALLLGGTITALLAPGRAAAGVLAVSLLLAVAAILAVGLPAARDLRQESAAVASSLERLASGAAQLREADVGDPAVREGLDACAASVGAWLVELDRIAAAQEKGDVAAPAGVTALRGEFARTAERLLRSMGGQVAVVRRVTGLFGAYARGLLAERVEPLPGAQRALGDAVEQARADLARLVAEVRRLTDGEQGRVPSGAGAPALDGEFRTMVESIQRLVATHAAARAAAERELAEVKERSDVLDDACGVGLWQAVLVEADAFHPESRWTWSPEFRRLLGYETETEFPDVCRSWSDRLHPEDAPRTFEAFGNHLKDATGEARYDVEYRLQVRDGSYRWFRATGGCRHAADGATIRACGSLTDIHARKVTELKLAADAAQEAREDRMAIGELGRGLAALADGDLTYRIETPFAAKTEPLRSSFNATAEKLGSVLSAVVMAVDQVSSASSQIASTSQAVASGASQQASTLTETTASLASMSVMTRQSADNAMQANTVAQTARSAAAEGTAAMNDMADTMSRIRASAESTSQIIKDINEIAFQTNLLALNAAVEAARAGEAGRGFAVVAEEVRSLALRSKEAATKTEELIRESVRQAGVGESMSRQVHEKLSTITQGIAKASDIVAEISATAKEQASGIDGVTRAVVDMEKVTQQNAASSEESSSAAEELSSQSQELASLVRSFRLASTAAPPRRAPLAQFGRADRREPTGARA
ncbi:MAG TPA: methyl-accepting chemotaxis protein [Anaeromyxobacter sp.]|nr:methyl-accepting chemotaxis protein [Anaeromyxobacter sp.]